MIIQPQEIIGAMLTIAALLLLLGLGKQRKAKMRGQAFVVYWSRAASTQFNVPVSGLNHAQHFVNTLNMSTVCGVSYIDANQRVTLLASNGVWAPNTP